MASGIGAPTTSAASHPAHRPPHLDTHIHHKNPILRLRYFPLLVFGGISFLLGLVTLSVSIYYLSNVAGVGDSEKYNAFHKWVCRGDEPSMSGNQASTTPSTTLLEVETKRNACLALRYRTIIGSLGIVLGVFQIVTGLMIVCEVRKEPLLRAFLFYAVVHFIYALPYGLLDGLNNYIAIAPKHRKDVLAASAPSFRASSLVPIFWEHEHPQLVHTAHCLFLINFGFCLATAVSTLNTFYQNYVSPAMLRDRMEKNREDGRGSARPSVSPSVSHLHAGNLGGPKSGIPRQSSHLGAFSNEQIHPQMGASGKRRHSGGTVTSAAKK